MHRFGVQIAISWASVIAIFLATEYAIFAFNLFWIIMGFWALCIAVLPAIMSRSVARILPFELLSLITVPFLLYFIPGVFGLENQFYEEYLLRASQVMATFLIGFVTVIDLHTYTSLRMNRVFAVAFTVMLTMALSSFFAIGDFISDAIFGTHTLVSNDYLMMNLLYSSIGGLIMGIVLSIYLGRVPTERLRRFGISRIGDAK
ncbi:MAG: hypothetical protein QHH00_04100 [Methanomassiliicoccales archaeon]|jgi:hypothetical protein|nr:hypothetical protein [Methanomassiliicoccales archaeon]